MNINLKTMCLILIATTFLFANELLKPEASKTSNWVTSGNAFYLTDLSSTSDQDGSFMVYATDNHWAEETNSISREIYTTPNTNYKFSWDAYAGGHIEGYYGYAILASNGDTIAQRSPIYLTRNGATEWKNLEVIFNSGNNNDVKLILHSFSTNWVAFDNFKVKKEDIIYCGDFLGYNLDKHQWNMKGHIEYIGDYNKHLYNPAENTQAILMHSDPVGTEISQKVIVQPNTHYQISWNSVPINEYNTTYFLGYSIADSKGKVLIANPIGDALSVTHTYNQKDSGWTNYTFDFYTSNENEIEVSFFPNDLNSIGFDNIRLRKSQQVRNSSFAGYLEWKSSGNTEYLQGVSATNDNSGSMKLWGNDNGDTNSQIEQTVSVIPNTNYLLKLKTNFIDKHNAYWGYKIIDKYGNVIVQRSPIDLHQPIINSWAEMVIPFNSGSDNEVTIILHSFSKDFVVFDDIILTREEQLINGDFKNALGWQLQGNTELITNLSARNDQSGSIKMYTSESQNIDPQISQKIKTIKNTDYKISYKVRPGDHFEGYFGYKVIANDGTIIKEEGPITVVNHNRDWIQFVANVNSNQHEEVTLQFHALSDDFIFIDDITIEMDYSAIKPVKTKDGDPFYPIGWYTWETCNDTGLVKMKEAGANTVLVVDLGAGVGDQDEMETFLDWGKENNVKFVLALHWGHILSKFKASDSSTFDYDYYKQHNPTGTQHYTKFLSTWVQRFQNHPALLGWQLGDEVSGGINLLGTFNACADYIRENDQNHQVWQVMCMLNHESNAVNFMEKVDVYSYDCYTNIVGRPFPELVYNSHIERSKRFAATNNWYGNINVTQAVGEKVEETGAVYTFPTLEQYRWNVFNPMTHGYRGTLNWIWRDHILTNKIERANFVQNTVPPVFSILKQFKHALETGWNVGCINIYHNELTASPSVLSKILLHDNTSGKYYLVVSNAANLDLNFTVNISHIPTTVSVLENFDTKAQLQLNSTGNYVSFNDAISSFGVNIYELR